MAETPEGVAIQFMLRFGLDGPQHDFALRALRAQYVAGLEAAAREADAMAAREKASVDDCAERAAKNNYFGDALAAKDCRGAQRGAEESAARIRELAEQAKREGT